MIRASFAQVGFLVLALMCQLLPALGDSQYEQDKAWTDKSCARILSNYHGPPLSELKKNCHLAQFLVKKDGTVLWTFHPAVKTGEGIKSASAKQVEQAIDKAILLSSPLAPPPLFHDSWPVMLFYDPNDKPTARMWIMDFPGEIDTTIKRSDLLHAPTDKWSKGIENKILSHLDQAKLATMGAWAAYWFWLNPDGTVQESAPVAVQGAGRNAPRTVAKIESMLQQAIKTSKTFEYARAPVSANEPVGVILLYVPRKPKGALCVRTFLFARPPNYAIISN